LTGTRLEEIPEHWETKRLKFLSLIEMGQSPPSEDYNQEGIGQPFLQGNAEFDTVHPKPRLWCDSANKFAKPQDILLSVRAPVGELNISDRTYGIGRGLCAITPSHSLTQKYLWHVLHFFRKGFDFVCSGSTYDAIKVDDVRNLPILQPPLCEQHIIANFLDHQTAIINDLIQKKEKLIQLLEEKRTALINRAVTKGLNSNVPMKDSGVEWLGKIPRHWDLLQLCRVVKKFVDYRGATPRKALGGIPLITAKNIRNNEINFEISQEFIADEDYDDWMVRGLPEIGDVLVTTEAPLGETAQILDTRVALAQRIVLLKADKDKMENDYLKYYLSSCSGRGELWSRATGSTALGIRAWKLKEILVIIPPKREQKSIIGYINCEKEKIESLITKISHVMEKLREYRSALITAAVTGKIDVRGDAS